MRRRGLTGTAAFARALGRVGVVLGLTVGCGAPGSGSSAAPMVRDSAGITIVENTGEAWGPDNAWRVEEIPILDIGGSDEDPVYDLGQVGGAVRFSDGRIGVANGATSEIRYYDSHGTHLFTKGRKGSGPGEYQSVTAMFPPAGDSLLVYDGISRRLTLLGPNGEVARTFYLGGESGFQLPTGGRMTLALPTGRFGNGAIVGMALGIQLDRATEGAFRDSVDFLLYDGEGATRDTMVRLPGVEMEMMVLRLGAQSFPSPSPVPLGRTTVTTAAGQRFYSSTNDAYVIEVRDMAGTPVRQIRVGALPVVIGEADRVAHRKEQLEVLDNLPQMAVVPEPMKEQIRDRVNDAVYPETFPFLVDLQVDPEGYLWAQEVQRPGIAARRYAVFDSSGVLLGRVTMPAEFRPTSVGTKHVVGIWEDADGLQHVRVHALSKP